MPSNSASTRAGRETAEEETEHSVFKAIILKIG